MQEPTVQEAAVQELVRRLAELAGNWNPVPVHQGEASDHPQQVILDLEIDGVRCLLIRLAAKPALDSITLTAFLTISSHNS